MPSAGSSVAAPNALRSAVSCRWPPLGREQRRGDAAVRRADRRVVGPLEGDPLTCVAREGEPHVLARDGRRGMPDIAIGIRADRSLKLGGVVELEMDVTGVVALGIDAQRPAAGRRDAHAVPPRAAGREAVAGHELGAVGRDPAEVGIAVGGVRSRHGDLLTGLEVHADAGVRAGNRAGQVDIGAGGRRLRLGVGVADVVHGHAGVASAAAVVGRRVDQRIGPVLREVDGVHPVGSSRHRCRPRRS